MKILFKILKYLAIALLPSLAWVGFIYLLSMHENPGDATGDFILLLIYIFPLSLLAMATVMLIDIILYYRKKKKQQIV